MRARRRFSAGSGSNRRRTTWATVEETTTLVTDGDYSTFDLLSNFKGDGGVQQAVTVARTHLRFVVTAPADPADQWAFGLIRGQSTDLGVNIAGAPVPTTDPYEDWLFWDLLTADTDGHYYQGGGNVWTYDIKSKRRLEELQMSYNCVLQSITASEPFVVKTTGRILLMLP